MLNFKKKYLKYKKKYLNLSGGEPKPWRLHNIDDYKNCIIVMIKNLNKDLVDVIRSELIKKNIYSKEFIISENKEPNNELPRFIQVGTIIQKLRLSFLKFKLVIYVKDNNIHYTLEYCKNNEDLSTITNIKVLSEQIKEFSYYQQIPDTLPKPTSFITQEYMTESLNNFLKLISKELLIPTIENYKNCINFIKTKEDILINIQNNIQKNIEYSLILYMNGEILSILNNIDSIIKNNIIISTIKYIIQIKIINKNNELIFEISYCFSHTDRVLNSKSNVQIDIIKFNDIPKGIINSFLDFTRTKKNIDLNNITLEEIKNINLKFIELKDIIVILTYINNIIKLNN